MIESVFKNMKSPKKTCDGITIFVVIAVIVIFLTLHYRNGAKLNGQNSLMFIEDVFTSVEKPSVKDNIFFHKIGIHLPLKLRYLSIFSFVRPEILKFFGAELTVREGCAVESAAIHNPDANIFVLFTNQSSWMSSNMSPILTTLLTYPNVHVRTTSLHKYLKNTPLDDYLGKKQHAFRLIENNSVELMRFLSLWHWGGTHLDFNTLVLRNLRDLRPNYVVANEETNHLTTSILNCFRFGIGRFVTGNYLSNYMRYYNEKDRIEHYDQKILEDIVRAFCDTKNLTEIVGRRSCSGLKVHGSKKFGEPQLLTLQSNSSSSRVFRNVDRWFAFYNNNQLYNESIYPSSNYGTEGLLAMKHCPRVFREAEARGL